MLLVTRQALLQVAGEGVGADIAEHLGVSVVALLELLQGLVGLGLVEKGVDRLQQAGVRAGRHGPGQVLVTVEIEGDAYVGEGKLVHRQLVGANQGQVDLPLVEHAQQVDHLDLVGLGVLQFGQALLQFGQALGMDAALDHGDALADQLLGLGRSRLAVAMHHLQGDIQIAVAEACQRAAAGGFDQAGGGQVRAVGGIQAGVQRVEAVGGFEFQLDAEALGEAFGEVVLEAGLAVAVLVVGGRAVAGNHAQHAFLPDPLEGGGLFATRAEQQDQYGRQQPDAVTQA
ncbi:hypothetical protein D9M71_382100 [compost metagenome]